MKKFLRVILAIIFFTPWAFVAFFTSFAISIITFIDWLAEERIYGVKEELKDIWLSLYRWVRG